MHEPNLMPEHLGEELLEAYTEGRISAGDRDRVEQHALECDDCLDHLVLSSLALQVTRRVRPDLREFQGPANNDLVA